MAMLRRAGLIETRNGVSGITLSKEDEEITLLDIYKAVQQDAEASLFDFHANPNPNCFVGGNIKGQWKSHWRKRRWRWKKR